MESSDRLAVIIRSRVRHVLLALLREGLNSSLPATLLTLVEREGVQYNYKAVLFDRKGIYTMTFSGRNMAGIVGRGRNKALSFSQSGVGTASSRPLIFVHLVIISIT
jgi:hypothetical protein